MGRVNFTGDDRPTAYKQAKEWMVWSLEMPNSRHLWETLSSHECEQEVVATEQEAAWVWDRSCRQYVVS